MKSPSSFQGLFIFCLIIAGGQHLIRHAIVQDWRGLCRFRGLTGFCSGGWARSPSRRLPSGDGCLCIEKLWLSTLRSSTEVSLSVEAAQTRGPPLLTLRWRNWQLLSSATCLRRNSHNNNLGDATGTCAVASPSKRSTDGGKSTGTCR
jgi:hypothetical protein